MDHEFLHRGEADDRWDPEKIGTKNKFEGGQPGPRRVQAGQQNCRNHANQEGAEPDRQQNRSSRQAPSEQEPTNKEQRRDQAES